MMLSPRTTQIFSPSAKCSASAERVGDAALAFLVGVIEVFEPELLAVGQQAQKIAGVPAAGDEQDLVDAGIDQSLDRVVNHRLVVDRQQMFVGDFGQRKQTAAGSAGEDDAFHTFFMIHLEHDTAICLGQN